MFLLDLLLVGATFALGYLFVQKMTSKEKHKEKIKLLLGLVTGVSFILGVLSGGQIFFLSLGYGMFYKLAIQGAESINRKREERINVRN